ncbi:MAG: RusA family crossover junction endodeoxyribonuclease [Alphaproteobacteria bacterium]
MADLYPFEFFVPGTPLSLQASTKSKERWKCTIKKAAWDRVHETDWHGFLDGRPLSLTVYYFTVEEMVGDVDNIVKWIMDALIGVAYLDDKTVERVVVQKFEPEVDWSFVNPSEQLTAALDTDPPVVYVRVDDDLGWRTL